MGAMTTRLLRRDTFLIALAVACLCMAALLAGCATGGVTAAQESTSHYKMGLNRMQTGNDEAALYEFNKAIEESPDNVDAHFTAGIVYYRQRNYDTAIREFSKVLSLDPRYADAHNNLGLAYVQKKRYDVALKEFRAATEDPLYKTRDVALINMGLTYDITGDHEMAAQAFREALLVQPGSEAAMMNLADQYNKLKKTDESIKYYKKVLEINPGNPSAHYELGLVYFKMGNNTEALDCFKKARELAPNTSVAASSDKYIELLK